MSQLRARNPGKEKSEAPKNVAGAKPAHKQVRVLGASPP